MNIWKNTFKFIGVTNKTPTLAVMEIQVAFPCYLQKIRTIASKRIKTFVLLLKELIFSISHKLFTLKCVFLFNNNSRK